jgi:ATP-dependent Clp protease adaptor protein ClpS
MLFEELEVLDTVDTDLSKKLVLFNDEINTFEHVIETLITVCKHKPLQAEQCTLIIHHTGKCSVKEGTYQTLVSMRDAIRDRGIKVEIQ